MKWAYDGLRAAGVGAEIRAFDWDRGAAFLDNLTDYQGNLQHAAAIADEIVEFERRRPGAPVDVVGYSGGGGLAILAVEALPQQVRVRNVLLVQAAISPDYDLTSVLSHIDGRLVNFYCPTDWVILGLGTQVFGTIDRTYTKSAGKDGFDVERAAPDRQLRGKIEQVRWTLEMLRSGHAGNHTGILMQQWNQRYLAPYLVPDNQSR